MPRLTQQRGVALIIVLMIVALVSVLATEMGARLQLQIKRVANIKDNNQAYWYAIGAEQFAEKSLRQLFKESGDVIHLNQPWAQEFTFPMPGGGIQAQLIDMRSCFNLNGVLSAPPSSGDSGGTNTRTSANNTRGGDDGGSVGSGLTPQQAFRSLLDNSELEIDSYNADTLSDALADWIDSDDNMRDFGAEDDEYSSRQFPYLAANTLMANKSELRLLKGSEQKWFAALLAQVCALPETVLKINVNTLDESRAPVLASVTGLSMQEAKDAIARRPEKGYQEIAKFFEEPEISKQSLTSAQKAWFDITTDYFILHTKTRYNSATFAMASVLHIDADHNISVIRREFGGVL